MKREIMSANNVSRNIVSNKRKTTLNPDYSCDTCGEPAMVVEMDRFYSCPECYLQRLGNKIKRLDHAGYYP
jgi:DNA-directed RNA polymerase subunit RPC12/RpoP